jgi:hypothetical protein
MNAKYLVVLLAALAMAGIASSAMAVELAAVMANPQQFEGKEVTLTAPIAENRVPEGGEYRTWSFVLDSCGAAGATVTAVESGFNPETLEKAYRLVEEARLKGDPVTMTGKLEEEKLGMRLELSSVQYGLSRVNTDEGPFVEDYYGDDAYPGTPRFYAGYPYYGPDFPEVEPPPAHIRFAYISGCPVEY